ncbi:MAG: lysophospholipid acyltransferase family protein [Acidobacteria bacterium]|nr:lysophospholipid acyltransferase family protein [Acidobacteriota bacterium]
MPPSVKRLLRSEPAQAAFGRLLGFYIAFVIRTTRWRLAGAEHFAPVARGEPVVAAFWHERLPMMATLWMFARRSAEARRRGTGVQILVSQHHDGLLVGRAMSGFGVGVVAGSSRRGGAAAVRALVRLIAAGNHLAISPDGPRGPARVAAPGVAQIAALTGVPVLPCAAQTTRRWVLPSWDRMVLPKPFGRGVVVCGPAISVPREDWQAALPAINVAIDAATETADRLCAA